MSHVNDKAVDDLLRPVSPTRDGDPSAVQMNEAAASSCSQNEERDATELPPQPASTTNQEELEKREGDDRDDVLGEDDEEIAIFISVEGDPTKRTPASDFIMNEGLKIALANAAEETEGVTKPTQYRRCDCNLVHNLMSCTQLHAADEVLRISKGASVRIKSLVVNLGYFKLLEHPKGSNPMCSSTKPNHDKLTCKALHLDERCVFVGRERLGYLPHELLDNQGLRNLRQNPTFTGRWCTNPARHEPKTCLFIHKAPPRGQTVGKRNNTNLQRTSKGNVVIATQPSALFTAKKRATTATVNRTEEIPKFAKEHQRELLDRLVAMIDDHTIEDVDAEIVAAASSSKHSARQASAPPVSAQASLSAENQGSFPTPGDTSSADKKTKRGKRGPLQTLRQLPTAVIVMLLAVLVALFVSFLPSS